jgi:hypothetical protein
LKGKEDKREKGRGHWRQLGLLPGFISAQFFLPDQKKFHVGLVAGRCVSDGAVARVSAVEVSLPALSVFREGEFVPAVSRYEKKIYQPTAEKVIFFVRVVGVRPLLHFWRR